MAFFLDSREMEKYNEQKQLANANKKEREIMEDILIIGILAVVILLAVLAIVKRFKSKASCCGSGSYVAKSRKLKTVLERKTFRVEGMHCQNCANRVMEDVQDIPGTSAAVNLKKGVVTVSLEQPVENAALIAAIEKHGYKVMIGSKGAL